MKFFSLLALPAILFLAGCSGRDVPGEDTGSLDPAAIRAYNEAIGQGKAGDTAGALAGYSRAIAIEPGFISARWNRGMILQDQGRLEEAITDFTWIIDAGKEMVDQAYATRGTCFHRLKRYDEAIRDYTRAMDLGQTGPSNYFNRGLVYLARKNDAEAEADFRKAADAGHAKAAEALKTVQKLREIGREQKEIDDDYAFVTRLACEDRLREARKLLDSREWEQARIEFDNALKILTQEKADSLAGNHPELIDLRAEVFFCRAEARLGMGQRKEAMADFAAGLSWKRGTGTPAWSAAIRRLLESQFARACDQGREKNYKEGIATLDAAIDLWKAGGAQLESLAELKRPGCDLFGERGRQRILLKEYRASLADLTEALRLEPAVLPPRANRAVAYYYLGQPRESLADLDQVLQASPKWSWAFQMRGSVKTWTGDFKGAQEDYESALASNFDWQSASEARTGNLLAGVLYQLGDTFGAEFEADLSMSAPSADAATRAESRSHFGWCARREGRYKEALREFDAATADRPETADVAVGRALCHLKLGDRDAAVQDFERALKLQPGLAKSDPVPRKADGRPYLTEELEELKPLLPK